MFRKATGAWPGEPRVIAKPAVPFPLSRIAELREGLHGWRTQPEWVLQARFHDAIQIVDALMVEVVRLGGDPVQIFERQP
jgi:hypothetical protein